MSITRRVILVVLGIFVAFVVYHAVTPWGWSGQLQTPPGAPVVTVTYTCGAPWGSAYAHGPVKTEYPLSEAPCAQRRTYQVMTAIDVLLGVFGLALVAGWSRVRHHPALT